MAVTHTLLISADTLKQNTTISQSIDENLIHPVILMAQDRYILPVLGTDLFEKLKTEIAASPADTPINVNKFSSEKSVLSNKEYKKLSRQERFLYNLNK